MLQKGVWCLRFFTKHLLISSSFDSRIKIWNLRKNTCVRTLFGHEGPVWAMAQKQNLLATASQDKTVSDEILVNLLNTSQSILVWS